MTIYIRVELDDSQFEQLLKKVSQSMEGLEDTPPQIVIYEGHTEAGRINLLHPQILEITDEKDRGGKLILEGKVHPGGEPFEIAIEP